MPRCRGRPHTGCLLHSHVSQGPPRCFINAINQPLQQRSTFPRVSSSDGHKSSVGQRADPNIWLRTGGCLRSTPHDRYLSTQDSEPLGSSRWSHGCIKSSSFNVHLHIFSVSKFQGPTLTNLEMAGPSFVLSKSISLVASDPITLKLASQTGMRSWQVSIKKYTVSMQHSAKGTLVM